MHLLKNKRNLKKEKYKLIVSLFFLLISVTCFGQMKTDISTNKKRADSLFLLSKDEVKKGDYEKAIPPAERSLLIF